MKISGIFNASHIPKRFCRIFKFFLILTAFGFGLFLLLNKIFPIPAQREFSTVIYAADSTLLSARLSPDEYWRLPAMLPEVSEDFLKIILFKEDRFFYWHPGVNPFSVFRAAIGRIRGVSRSGASTITMQIARMLEPKPRVFSAKLVEMFRAIQLEWHFSKQELLEMYVNELPFGGNVEGIKSAAYLYFNRPPEKLSLAQACLLAMTPKDPNRLRPDRVGQEVIEERNRWLLRFAEKGLLSGADVQVAQEEFHLAARYPMPVEAPHFTNRVAGLNPGRTIQTTLSPAIQREVERIVKKRLPELRAMGIGNLAILVANTQKGEILAWEGSGDFNSMEFSGQVDGVRAIRSPGSTLKPLLYAQAFDKGLLTPEMKLPDIPLSFLGFTPFNFDYLFRGEVTVRYALQYSLNIPAVWLLRETGVKEFSGLLKKAGFQQIAKDENRLGLSLILGGCGVSLFELTGAMGALWNEGHFRPLIWNRANFDTTKGTRLFTKGAAAMTYITLQNNEVPEDLLAITGNFAKARPAWKTGTSFAKKDAWCVGVNPDYLVGVWAGNFDGRGAPELSGLYVAMPVLFDLYNRLPVKKALAENPLAERLVFKREICRHSGMPPGPHCTDIRSGSYLPGISPGFPCNRAAAIYTDSAKAESYCMACLPLHWEKEFVHFFPPQVQLWLAKEGLGKNPVPVHHAACSGASSGPGPEIVSPVADFEYYIDPEIGTEIRLEAAVQPGTDYLYWFVNGEFLVKSEPNRPVFYSPQPGILEIRCLDDRGRSDRVRLPVRAF